MVISITSALFIRIQSDQFLHAWIRESYSLLGRVQIVSLSGRTDRARDVAVGVILLGMKAPGVGLFKR